MRIDNPKTGDCIINPFCTGVCYCHSLPIQFGTNPHSCAECGCPKTETGFARWKAEHPQKEAPK